MAAPSVTLRTAHGCDAPQEQSPCNALPDTTFTQPLTTAPFAAAFTLHGLNATAVQSLQYANRATTSTPTITALSAAVFTAHGSPATATPNQLPATPHITLMLPGITALFARESRAALRSLATQHQTTLHAPKVLIFLTTFVHLVPLLMLIGLPALMFLSPHLVLLAIILIVEIVIYVVMSTPHGKLAIMLQLL